MPYFESTAMLQLVPEKLGQLFNDNGWQTYGRYRAFAPLAGDAYRKKFADVRLFTSLGSDMQQRYFGVVHSYGVETATPIGEEPIITQSSDLGVLGFGNGTKTIFNFPVFPVLPGSAQVYVNGVEVTTGFTIDTEKGTVTFTAAPATSAKISATYNLSDNAPSTAARLLFFTFDGIRNERPVRFDDAGIGQNVLGTGTGAKTAFTIPIKTGNSLKPLSVLQVALDGVLVDPSTYSVDYALKTVTFTLAPATNVSVSASYIELLTPDASKFFGDFQVASFASDDLSAVMGAVYNTINFILPSPPTVASFIPDDTYSQGWSRDSAIYLWGNANKDRIMMFLLPDPAPNPTKVFYTPLYLGRISTIGQAPKRNMIIAAGTRLVDEIATTPALRLGRYSVDYGENTGNGNSGIVMQQSIGGAYYQQYYLSFITHDGMMESSAESRFNPSAYTGKYHISPIYVVHPNDGYVGRLDEVYAVHPKNISQMDELEVIEFSKDEDLGKGDGIKRTFHLFHAPFGTSIEVRLDCSVAPGADYVLNKADKTITFTNPPGPGAELSATYEYRQVYKYTLANTPVSTFNSDGFTPYPNIGVGILKENLV